MNVDLMLLDRVVSYVDEGINLGVRIGELPDSSVKATRVGSVAASSARPVNILRAMANQRASMIRSPRDRGRDRLLRAANRVVVGARRRARNAKADRQFRRRRDRRGLRGSWRRAVSVLSDRSGGEARPFDAHSPRRRLRPFPFTSCVPPDGTRRSRRRSSSRRRPENCARALAGKAKKPPRQFRRTRREACALLGASLEKFLLGNLVNDVKDGPAVGHENCFRPPARLRPDLRRSTTRPSPPVARVKAPRHAGRLATRACRSESNRARRERMMRGVPRVDRLRKHAGRGCGSAIRPGEQSGWW